MSYYRSRISRRAAKLQSLFGCSWDSCHIPKQNRPAAPLAPAERPGRGVIIRNQQERAAEPQPVGQMAAAQYESAPRRLARHSARSHLHRMAAGLRPGFGQSASQSAAALAAAEIAAADGLKILPFRADVTAPCTPAFIWAVVLPGE